MTGPIDTNSTKPLRVVLFSTLYPSSALLRAGIFVETRLRELLKTGRVSAKVVAPIRWSPVHHARFGVYAQIAAAPKRESLHGIDVLHPRFITLPKIGMNIAPFLLAVGAARALSQLRKEGFDFDVIDAHYYYPDGVAAALLSKWFDRPLAITARGSDVNLISNHAWPRWLMKKASKQAYSSIGVSNALVDKMQRLDFESKKLLTIRNGIDLDKFSPLDQTECRSLLGIKHAPVLLTVGNLKEQKGQRLVVKSLPAILAKYPGAQLIVLGDGPDKENLVEISKSLDLANAVRFVKTMPQEQLRSWYSAADVLILASSSEGWPNVLLEAMACGARVVATDVGGVREIVSDEKAGRVVSQRNETSIAQAVCEILAEKRSRSEVRVFAEQFDWMSTSLAQVELFEHMVGAIPVRPSSMLSE